MSSSGNELFKKVQEYTRAVMVDRLCQEGFASYDGEDIHWYRLVNNDVVHAVYFARTRSCSGFSGKLDMRYGCHPLFIPPILQKSPHISVGPGNEQMYDIIPELIPGSTPHGIQRTWIYGELNTVNSESGLRQKNIEQQNHAVSVLEKVLSVLNNAQTPRDCYDIHKEWRASQIQNNSWLSTTPYFVDEALYWDDRDMYPFCRSYVFGMANHLRESKNRGLLKRKIDTETLAQLEVLENVFTHGHRDAYVETFHGREQKTIRLLKKHTKKLF